MGFDDFPPALREIPDAPKRLYIRGNWPSSDYALLAVVGSRRYSAYGKHICERLIGELASYKVAIVSGLALGIDSIAHEAALASRLPTIAVLPSGLSDKSIYPAQHQPLAQKILSAGGALVSEYEPEARPALYTFPARNRIMAGVSQATLLIEAAERSGTLITARLALDYNREVLAVPHPLQSETGAGGNLYIRLGATLVRSGTDILEALGIAANLIEKPIAPDLVGDEKEVYDALSESCDRGELSLRCGMSQQRINVALSLLLIKGIVRETLGKIARV